MIAPFVFVFGFLVFELVLLSFGALGIGGVIAGLVLGVASQFIRLRVSAIASNC